MNTIPYRQSLNTFSNTGKSIKNSIRISSSLLKEQSLPGHSQRKQKRTKQVWKNLAIRHFSSSKSLTRMKLRFGCADLRKPLPGADQVVCFPLPLVVCKEDHSMVN